MPGAGSLPYSIAYLTTLKRPGGGELVHLGETIVRANIWPPNTSVTYNVFPLPGTYASIYFKMGFSPMMVPDAFYVTAQQFGARFYAANVSSLLLSYGIDYYAVILDKAPSITTVTNLTALNQFFEEGNELVVIQTREDYDIAMEALTRMGTSEKTEKAQLQTAHLLSLMEQGMR